MINFLRKIRRELFAEANGAKYVKYAIGEIILVMIGILLALQVNNWNEQRKANQFEATLLSELLQSAEEDIERIKTVIERNQDYVLSANIALEAIDNNSVFNDSLANHLNNAFKVWRIYFETSAYDNIKEYGLHIIKNDETRKTAISAYNARSTFVDELYLRYQQFQYNVVEPVLVETTEMKEVEDYGSILVPLQISDERTRLKLTYLLQRSIDLKDQIIRAKQRTLNAFQNLQKGLIEEIQLHQ